MKYQLPLNPFPTTGYYGPNYFCNRELESKKLTQLLTNGQSCLLIGNRRLGKTALILHVKGLLPKDWRFIYLDILSTENELQFLNALGGAVLQNFSETDTLGKKVWEFIKSLRPIISFDQLNGLPQVSFQTTATEKPTKDILVFLAQLENPTVIAIDEFQQIHEYPEKNTDAWLRSAIQQLQNVCFLFSGSRQSILTEMFSDPSRPFYKSASPIKLEKIELGEYRNFIIKTFGKHGKDLSEELAEQILGWTKCYTYYVQLLCNRLFQLQKKSYVQEDWQSCAKHILDENETFFLYYRTLLRTQQWKLLVAIAKTGTVYAPTSKDFILKNRLGSSATVFKSLDSLLEKELIFKEYDPKGNLYYEVYDVFFERWIQSTY
ncbi:AAA family ATPase [Algoriphagus sp.]|uniref:AAA family ATPase n=1 Tax=Algoriphagus sp. TaxID=1872435 RepID=UPI003F72FCB4